MESLSYLKAAAKHTCRKFSTREWGSEWGWGSSNNELLKDDKDCVVCQKNAKEIMDLFKTPIERTIEGRKSKSRVDSDFYEFDYSKNVNVFIGYSAYNTLCWRMQMDSREENDFHECMVCLNKEVYWVRSASFFLFYNFLYFYIFKGKFGNCSLSSYLMLFKLLRNKI